jgi:glycosyltransferase involved in cell wall biosynthesis
LKVLITISNPDKSKKEKDYYLVNLVNHIKRSKIEINFLDNRYFFFPISRKVLTNKVKIVNVHWINGFTKFSKNPVKMLFGTLFFILDILFLKLLIKTKIIWTVHNLYSHELFFPRVEYLIRKFFGHISDFIIVHCKHAKSIFSKEFGINKKKIAIIPHGNYINNYPNNISKKKAREILNLDYSDFIFIHFGRLRRHKNIELVIDSFQGISKSNIKLIIAGNPLKSLLRKLSFLVKNRENIISRFEFIPDNEIQVYMKAADVVILSYRRILTSGEALLAMTFKKPLIAPKLGYLKDILDEKNAFFYEYNSKESLRKALKTAFKERQNLSVMGRNSYQKAKKNSWDNIASKYIKLFKMER